MAQIAAEIRDAIQTAATGPPVPDRKFNKDGGFVAYGLKVPAWRAIMRSFRPRIRALSLDERLRLAETLFAEGEGWLGHSAICVLALSAPDLVGAEQLPESAGPPQVLSRRSRSPRPPQLLSPYFERLDRMADRFTGWSHVDDVCISVLQPLLLAHRAQTLSLLERWNRSPNRWKRRASVVTFTRKIGASGAFTDEALRLCENLVLDSEDLVRKGVGWALKDVMRGDPDRVLAYVKELRRRGVSAVITLYAIRDLRNPERAEVLSVRN